MLLEHGLVIKGVHMARPTVHEAKDDVLRFRREMSGRAGLTRKQSIQCEHAESGGCLLKKATTGECGRDGAGAGGVFHRLSGNG